MTTSRRRLKPVEIALLVVPLCALAFASWRMANQSAPQKSFAPPRYFVTDLGAANTGSLISDMNDKGEIVGAWGATNKTWRPVVWRNGKMQFLSRQSGIATAINNKGVIVLNIGSNIGSGSAFLIKNGKTRRLGSLGGAYSYAADINDKEEIVGFADAKDDNGNSNSHAFLWKNGVMQDISGEDNAFRNARAINERGEVTGVCEPRQACVWNENELSLLSQSVDGRDINNKGVVLAQSTAIGTDDMSDIWIRGRRQNIDFGKSIEYIHTDSLNDQNQFVGMVQRKTAKPFRVFAFLCTENQVYNLNALITPGGWYLRFAHVINNRGQIVGEGTLNGTRRFFLLTPQTLATSSTR